MRDSRPGRLDFHRTLALRNEFTLVLAFAMFIFCGMSIGGSDAAIVSASTASSNYSSFANEVMATVVPNHAYHSEHIPLYLPEKRLLVCRTPKVGSLYLRSVFMAHKRNESYNTLRNAPLDASSGVFLSNTTDISVLFGNGTDRLFFVRDPLTRTLAGYLEMAHHRTSPSHFRNWTFTRFAKDYTDKCDENARHKSMDSRKQHWSPAQFCRCGFDKFKIPFRTFKIEEVSPHSILGPWFDAKYLGPSMRTHGRSYEVSKYLTHDVSEYIRNVTRRERQYFGYEGGVLVPDYDEY